MRDEHHDLLLVGNDDLIHGKEEQRRKRKAEGIEGGKGRKKGRGEREGGEGGREGERERRGETKRC